MVYLSRLNLPDFEKVKKFQDEGKAGITSGQREPSFNKLATHNSYAVADINVDWSRGPHCGPMKRSTNYLEE